MRTGFLVELRLRGYAREYARWARTRVLLEARKLGVRRLRQGRFVPHITLFGGAETNDLTAIQAEVERIGRKYTLVPFGLGVKRGTFRKEDANWLYVNVRPSPELEQFRQELAQRLLKSEAIIPDTCQPHDHRSHAHLHCSLAKFDPRDDIRFEKLCYYAEAKCSLEAFRQHKASVFGRLLNIIKPHIFRVEEADREIDLHLARVTLLGNRLGRRSHIEREYDLILKQSLSRAEALDPRLWRKTTEKLRRLRGLVMM